MTFIDIITHIFKKILILWITLFRGLKEGLRDERKAKKKDHFMDNSILTLRTMPSFFGNTTWTSA